MRKFIWIFVCLLMLIFVFAQDKKLENNEVPDFLLYSLDGEEVFLSEYTQEKELSFLVFFTTWCPWCSKQMEAFEELNATVSDNILFLAVGMDNDRKKIQDKVMRLGVTYPVVSGTNEIAGFFKVSGIPVTIVIGKDNIVLDQVVGYRDQKYFEKYLKE